MRMGVLGNCAAAATATWNLKKRNRNGCPDSAQEGVAYFATIMLKQKVNMKNQSVCKLVLTRRPLGASLSITLP